MSNTFTPMNTTKKKKPLVFTMSELMERLEDYNMANIICNKVATDRYLHGKCVGKIQWGKFKDIHHIVANFRDVADTDLVDTKL